MKLYKAGVISLCLFLILLAGIYLFYSFYVIEEVIILPADVYVSDEKIGFNLDKDQVHFGIVKKGMSSSLRFIEINNNRAYPVEVIIGGQGEIKDWLFSYLKEDEEVKGPKYRLEAGANKTITLGLVPDKEAEVGKYTGEIKILVKKTGY